MFFEKHSVNIVLRDMKKNEGNCQKSALRDAPLGGEVLLHQRPRRQLFIAFYSQSASLPGRVASSACTPSCARWRLGELARARKIPLLIEQTSTAGLQKKTTIMRRKLK